MKDPSILKNCNIYSHILEYIKDKPSIWHTPGHKGTLCAHDITEIDEAFPSDLIENAEKFAAELFGAKHVRFLTGGSSIGIKAGLMSLPGDVLIEEGCHRAVTDGIKLSLKNAVVIPNEKLYDLPLPLTAKQIEKALEKNRNIKTLVLTSPNYYGQTAQAIEISQLVKKYGLYLYVDAAHGAHFPLRRDLFPNDFTSTADICNISAHKTLPALTQSAYLCINNDSLAEKIDENLELLGTTSPSYPLLSSLEYAAHYSKEYAGRYDELKAVCSTLKARVSCLENDDFSRIVIDAGHYGLSGEELYFRLKRLGVVGEKYTFRHVVLIVSIVDSSDSILALSETILSALNIK